MYEKKNRFEFFFQIFKKKFQKNFEKTHRETSVSNRRICTSLHSHVTFDNNKYYYHKTNALIDPSC